MIDAAKLDEIEKGLEGVMGGRWSVEPHGRDRKSVV